MYQFRSRRLRMRTSSRIVLLSRLSNYLFFGLIGLIVVGVIMFFWFSRDLPTPGKLVNSQSNQSTQIFDRNGVLLYSVHPSDEQNRVYVDLSKIPKNLQDATVSVEDKNFYQNQGFDPLSYLRVAKDIVLQGRVTGGSGITQQLVRNTLISNERTLPRKIKELILAIQVNGRYSKDQILEMYLNNVPYGGGNTGVEAASQAYFGKHVEKLDLAESAMLAGLPQGPSLYSPFSGNKYYINRSQDVLKSMVDNKYITQKQADAALSEIKNMKFSQRDTSIKAPHFVFYVKKLLEDQFHFTEQQIETGGLQVTTTLDYEIEKKAEDIVKTEVDDLQKKNYKVTNGAAIVTNPKTGEILTMVGSRDYFNTTDTDGNLNIVTDALRQPGSSMKPIIYATAFEKGYTPASMIMDSKTEFPN
jgi:membrane peptidoglycan carboxypeptidase